MMPGQDSTSLSQAPRNEDGVCSRNLMQKMFGYRLVLLLAVIAFAFSVIIVRLTWMQVFHESEYTEKAEKKRTYLKILPPERGRILFRQNIVAARMEGTFNVAAMLPELDARFSAIDILVKYARPTRREISKRMLQIEDTVSRSANHGSPRLFVEGITPKGVQLIRMGIREDPDLKASFIFRKNPYQENKFDLYLRFDRLTAKKCRTIESLSRFLGEDSCTLHGRTDDAVRSILEITNAFEYRVRRDTPLVLLKVIKPVKAYELRIRSEEFPGIMVCTGQRRFYPHGTLFCHGMGYLGKFTPSEYELLESNGSIVWRSPKVFNVLEAMRKGSVFFADEDVGRAGIERIYETFLAGEKGIALFERWPSQAEPVVQEHISPVPGIDIHLTIDAQLQRVAQDVFKCAGENGEPLSGAAIVLDVRTGAILVMASSPGFDLNTFREPAEYEKLKSLPSSFLNRAIQAPAPPGSVFKVLVAIAALEENVISKETHIRCRGYLHNPSAFRCRNHAAGIPPMEVAEALCRSCNVFFYTLGEKLNTGGRERLQEWAAKCGFGSPTGVDIPGERSGVLHDPMWKKNRLKLAGEYLEKLELRKNAAPQELALFCEERNKISTMKTMPKVVYKRFREIESKITQLENEIEKLPEAIKSARRRLEWAKADSEWTKGNDRFLGIGEGGVTVTPLQVARFIAAIANGGKFYRPHLLAAAGGSFLDKKIEFSPKALAVVRRGMEMVVHDPRGTASHSKDAHGNRVPSALSYLPVAAKTGTAETDRRKGLNQAWIAGYGPLDAPEIAFVITVEKTKSHGGEVCGSIAAQILSHYFARREGP